MLKCMVIVGWIVFGSASLCAQTSVWQVESGTSRVYLGGTVHVLKRSDFPLPAPFDIAYADAAIVAFETDLAAMASARTQQRLLAKSRYTDGTTLPQVLSPDAYRILKAYCERVGLPVASLHNLKPSVAMLTLLALELQKLGVVPGGVDDYFFRKASADGKQIDRLETLEEHIDYITSMADGHESAFVIQSIQEMHKIKQMLGDMITAWRDGDIAALSSLFLEELQRQFPKLHKRLLVERNNKWLAKIETYLRTPEKEFVLVGVGHMVGADGLLEQLKQRGYTVKMVRGGP